MSSIGNVPEEILVKILSYLEYTDIPKASGTCHKWRRIIRDHLIPWCFDLPLLINLCLRRIKTIQRLCKSVTSILRMAPHLSQSDSSGCERLRLLYETCSDLSKELLLRISVCYLFIY